MKHIREFNDFSRSKQISTIKYDDNGFLPNQDWEKIFRDLASVGKIDQWRLSPDGKSIYFPNSFTKKHGETKRIATVNLNSDKSGLDIAVNLDGKLQWSGKWIPSSSHVNELTMMDIVESVLRKLPNPREQITAFLKAELMKSSKSPSLDLVRADSLWNEMTDTEKDIFEEHPNLFVSLISSEKSLDDFRTSNKGLLTGKQFGF